MPPGPGTARHTAASGPRGATITPRAAEHCIAAQSARTAAGGQRRGRFADSGRNSSGRHAGGHRLRPSRKPTTTVGLFDQIKSVLAVIGVALLFFNGLRLFGARGEARDAPQRNCPPPCRPAVLRGVMIGRFLACGVTLCVTCFRPWSRTCPACCRTSPGMLASRGYNIDSLAVGETEDPHLSRMTFVVVGDDSVLEQVRKQLEKIVTVVRVDDISSQDHVERDLMLIKVAAANGTRSEIRELTDIFRGRIVDVAPDMVMIEISGQERKIEAFIELMRPFGIIELVRTGRIAMVRGKKQWIVDSESVVVESQTADSHSHCTMH